jgi:hypothetical protein
MEFLVGSRKQEEQALERLKEISQSVIEDKFSEDIWRCRRKACESLWNIRD